MTAQIEKLPFIEAKLPLVWLLGTAATVIFAMGGVYVKLDGVTTQLTKLEAKVDQRDDRIGLLQTSIIQANGKNDTQQTQIDRNSTDLTDIKRTLEYLRQSPRYMPK